MLFVFCFVCTLPAFGSSTFDHIAPASGPAAGEPTLALVDLLLGAGADVRALNVRRETVLHLACTGGRVGARVACVVRRLLQCGADAQVRRIDLTHGRLDLTDGAPLETPNSRVVATDRMVLAPRKKVMITTRADSSGVYSAPMVRVYDDDADADADDDDADADADDDGDDDGDDDDDDDADAGG
eukprot:1192161-Prorocentrum_minimum.AAC.2